MIIFGDLACPTKEMANTLRQEIAHIGIFKDRDLILGNLEGVILDEKAIAKRGTLYNCPEVTKVFEKERGVVYSLANNHIFDYPEKIVSTKRLLEKEGIGTTGIFEYSNQPEPFRVQIGGVQYSIFGHCWRVMTKVVQNKVNSVRIFDSSYEEVLGAVRKERNRHPAARIVVYFHWNYDLERLPFPAHRKLSKRLIDEGANIIAGNHSHPVNGGEAYKNGIIVYGLGNFFIPDGFFFDGKLSYPDQSHLTLVLDVKEEIEESKCHWIQTRSSNNIGIDLVRTENFLEGDLISQYSPFRGMSDKEYCAYFKLHREKSLLVPVWKDYSDSLGNRLRDVYATLRIKAIRFLNKRRRGY